ncbi:MAG: mandelate racemase/muconate lactonizing enzyme family protein [Spirochaetes bacterium]|nr:mandelate racemase/muconate lactonizing enzyme family protein [Spirochaetota bacterium]
MKREDTIAEVNVHMVSERIQTNIGDATRQVESIGYIIVRILTKNGQEGIGITYNEVGGEAIKALILHSIKHKLIGRDPFDTERIWQELSSYLRGVGRKGLSFCALSAIDIALWDLKGKILQMPLYKLLGGGDTRVPVYASGGWTTFTDEELVEEMKSMVAEGYQMVKFKVGYAGGKKPNRDLERVRKVREALGPEVIIMLDANNCWDAATAIRFANYVKEYDVFFLEEPVFADDIPGLAKYRRGTDLPLATGEHEYTKYGIRELVLHEAVDIVQFDIARAGGYTEMLKISAIAQAWNLKFAPHAMENIHIHLLCAMPNGLFLERLRIFETLTSNVFINPPMPVEGYITIPDLPGLGLTLNMDYIKDQE